MEQGEVRALLRTHWDLVPERVEPLSGGMNSQAWDVVARGERWVVKSVVARHTPAFEAGLRAATVLEEAGIPAGAPRATTSGAAAVRLPGETLALLRWVEGRELGADGADVALIGQALGSAHRHLSASSIPGAPAFDWIDPGVVHLGIEPWIRPSVRAVLAEWAAVRSRVTTWSFIHGDPAPEAFIEGPTPGAVGIIDWASGVFGPCLYDLASAAMYLGDEVAPELVEAYREHGPVHGREIDAGLPTLLRVRYAVQADYFARRLHENDLTGLADRTGNQKGLDDARRFLGA